jgi:hypothetical protein
VKFTKPESFRGPTPQEAKAEKPRKAERDISYAPSGFADRLPLQNRLNMHCNICSEMMGVECGAFRCF